MGIPREKIVRGSMEFYEAWRTFDEDRRRQPGALQPDGTVYLGKYAPQGILGKAFNVFAAPQDMTAKGFLKKKPHSVFLRDGVIAAVSKLRNWHGHDGEDYFNDEELHKSLERETYKGGWVIPPCELLTGSRPDGAWGICPGHFIQPDNIFAHKDRGGFKGTFKAAANNDFDLSGVSDFTGWYWSSTGAPDYPHEAYAVRLLDGYARWGLALNSRLSCRPVRLVPV